VRGSQRRISLRSRQLMPVAAGGRRRNRGTPFCSRRWTVPHPWVALLRSLLSDLSDGVPLFRRRRISSRGLTESGGSIRFSSPTHRLIALRFPGSSSALASGPQAPLLTVSTGQPACCTTRSAVEPRSRCARPVRPCVPMAIISQSISSATRTMTSGG